MKFTLEITLLELLDLIIALGTIGILLMGGYMVYWWVKNELAPTQKVYTRVALKRTKISDGVSIPKPSVEMFCAQFGMLGRRENRKSAAKALLGTVAHSEEIEVGGGTDFYVTYVVDGKNVEFLVNESAYMQSEEGSEGWLTYKGERFMSFIPGGDNRITNDEKTVLWKR